MDDAKSRPSEPVDLGERIVIARGGVPLTDLLLRRPRPARRHGGRWQRRARIADDFDAPVPEMEALLGR